MVRRDAKREHIQRISKARLCVPSIAPYCSIAEENCESGECHARPPMCAALWRSRPRVPFSEPRCVHHSLVFRGSTTYPVREIGTVQTDIMKYAEEKDKKFTVRG